MTLHELRSRLNLIKDEATLDKPVYYNGVEIMSLEPHLSGVKLLGMQVRVAYAVAFQITGEFNMLAGPFPDLNMVHSFSANPGDHLLELAPDKDPRILYTWNGKVWMNESGSCLAPP